MNNQQIDGTSYYCLPNGGQLEDFIAYKGMSFALGSAVKYAWRAGKKDGESKEKDTKKIGHYVRFLAKNCPPLRPMEVTRRENDPQGYEVGQLYWHHRVIDLVEEAKTWRKGGVRG